MKATLLVLLLSVVGVTVSCGLQQSEWGAGSGCSLGKRLAFDLKATLEESKRMNKEYFDCPNPEPGVPCFYYSHIFYPFFVVEDTVLGESDRFLGNESSQQTLVWMFEDIPDSFPVTKEGFIVMNGTSNRVRWLCQGNSPCGDLTPRNLLDPDFFFIIEVSNKETDSSTYCEHTLRFELHVHGFPLDPMRGLFYMQMTVITIESILVCYIVHTCCKLSRKTDYTSKTTALKNRGQKQFKAGDLIVKVGWTLHSWFLQLYRIIFSIVQPMFDHFIMLVLLIDTSTLMAQTFQGVTVRIGWCFSALDACFLAIYVMEAVFKILVWGRTYFRNPWSDLDLFIMLMSLVDCPNPEPGVLKTFKGARAVRALRLLKAIRFFKSLQAILLTCLQSFWSRSSIIILMFLFLFIFAVVFWVTFNESDPEHFGSIFRTIFTLFQILTLDDWSLIYMTSRDNGAPHIIYFLALYILVELFTFLNVFIAVLVDNFQLSIRKKRPLKSRKSPDANEGGIQSIEKIVEVLEMSQSEIEEELYKEALRHASSENKHSKRKIELITRHLQLMAAMDQHMQKTRMRRPKETVMSDIRRADLQFPPAHSSSEQHPPNSTHTSKSASTTNKT